MAMGPGTRCLMAMVAAFMAKHAGISVKAKISDFADAHQIAKGLHDFFIRGDAVPDVHPVKVNIVGPKTFQRRIQRAV